VRIPRHPRWLHRVYALLNGYFWLPCPVCGRKFGGHEWGTYGHERIPLPTKPSSQVGVCPWCAPTARRAHEAVTGVRGANWLALR
jgi:hypothetical protein